MNKKTDEPEWQITAYPDLMFTVAAKLGGSHHVSIKIYEITGLCNEGTPLYGEEFSPDLPLIPYLHGFIKWDGCSHWHFDEQEDCMLHMCGFDDWNYFHSAMLNAFYIAKTMMGDKWDGSRLEIKDYND